MIYGYARVSTKGQQRDGNSLEEQEKQLRANGAGQVFIDAFTGTKLERPEFQKLLAKVQPGDTIMVTKLDRVSRSASKGIALVDELLAKNVSMHILNMGLMNNTPTGKLIRNIMFSFAEFERDMIVERTMEGKAIAREKPGYKEGREKIAIDAELFRDCVKKQAEGLISIADACKMLGISQRSWYYKLKSYKTEGVF